MRIERSFKSLRLNFNTCSPKHIISTPYLYTRKERESFTLGLNFLWIYLSLTFFSNRKIPRDLLRLKGRALDFLANNYQLTRGSKLRFINESDRSLRGRILQGMKDRSDIFVNLSEFVNVKELDDYRPHSVASMTCPKCSRDWTATYPSSCTSLECPGCGHFVRL